MARLTVSEIIRMNSNEFARWCEEEEDDAGAVALELEARLVDFIEEQDDPEELRRIAVVLAESMDIMTSIDALVALDLEQIAE